MSKKITGGKWFWESSETNQTPVTPVTQSESKPKNTFMSYFTLPAFLKSQPKTQDNAKPAQTPAVASNMLGGKRKTKRVKKSKKSKTSKAKK